MQAIQATPESKTPPVPSARAGTDLPFLYPALEIKTGSMEAFVESLPFSFRDVTAGAENEFQAVVLEKREDVDLPITIESANFFKNMVRRAASGEPLLKPSPPWNGIWNRKTMSGKIPGSGFLNNASTIMPGRCLPQTCTRTRQTLVQDCGRMPDSSDSPGPGRP